MSESGALHRSVFTGFCKNVKSLPVDDKQSANYLDLIYHAESVGIAGIGKDQFHHCVGRAIGGRV